MAQANESSANLSAEELLRIFSAGVHESAVCFIDPQGNIMNWNEGAERLYGYRSNEVIGRHFSIFYPEAAIKVRLPELVLETATRTGRYEAEIPQMRKGGAEFWASVIVSIRKDRDGAVLGFARFVRDLTEKKLAESAIQMEAEKMRSVVENVMDAIITINEKAEMESWNSAAKKVFGYEAAEVLGRNVQMLMPEPYRSEHDAYVSNYLKTGHAKIIGIGREVVGRRKDGTLFPMDLAVSEFKIGAKRYFTGVVRDITERKRTAEELKAAKEAAVAANIAKTAFLANMSHEIRTPLGAVIGFAELLSDPDISQEEREAYAATIRRNGDLLSGLIEDILDLSKVEVGKVGIDVRDVWLPEILKEAESTLGLKAREKGIALNIVTEENAPLSIRTDPLRLRQVLMNVVGNAIKFTEHGFVNVIVKSLDDAASSKRVAFVVQDTGRGISPENISRLFTPFSQVDASIRRQYGGTGLGLMLSKRLAKLLGGDVVLTESKPGVGSTFTITIDAGEARGASEPAKAEKKAEATKTGVTRLDGVQVLLADDALDNQVLVSRILGRAGAVVELASNGLEAIEKINRRRYDVVLMDLQMPVMDGFTATAELRKQGYLGQILALSAHALKEERERTLASGFDDHLVKPFGRDELIQRVALSAGCSELL